MTGSRQPYVPATAYAPGGAAMVDAVGDLSTALTGIRTDLEALLPLLLLSPDERQALRDAPIGTWAATLRSLRAARPTHPPGTPQARGPWTSGGNRIRPEGGFFVRNAIGAVTRWEPLDTPGTGRRAEQLQTWRRVLAATGPFTEITEQEYRDATD
jgi:hypothetical protein